MSDVLNLGEARVSKKNSAKAWTVVEALRWALQEVESGRIDATMVYVAFQTRNGDLRGYPQISAGLNDLETVGLLAQHLHFRSTP